MKKTHYLKTTFVVFFLSLSFLLVFFTSMKADEQEPWLSDLHPQTLSLLTPWVLRIFPTSLSPSPFLENQTTEPRMISLREPLSGLAIASQVETPALPNVESEKPLESLHFHETEGVYFGQHAPRLKSLLSISGKKKIRKQVEKAAVEIGVDPRLAKAMAAVESGYDQRAVSPKGAIGVLQLMPRFFCRDSALTLEMLFDPDVNIRVGLTHFKSLLDRFNENIDLSLAAYNAGAQRVIEAGRTIPPLEQTQNYVRKVKKAMDQEDLGWPSLDRS